jgi:predicted dehydrogenase
VGDYIMEDDMYVNEMQHFMGAIEGRNEYMYSLADDREILELLYAAEKSSAGRTHVDM